jgi:hypothetical protein
MQCALKSQELLGKVAKESPLSYEDNSSLGEKGNLLQFS